MGKKTKKKNKKDLIEDLSDELCVENKKEEVDTKLDSFNISTSNQLIDDNQENIIIKNFSLNAYNKNKNNLIKGFGLNYSYMQASFESAHTLPAANHPNSINDVVAGNIIPGMPQHKINANVTYNLLEDFNITTGVTGATGVFLRGDESNQLNKTSPYVVFNLQSEYSPKKNINFFLRIENILNSEYETMGVLGEAESDEVNVPIAELGDTGKGDTAVGPLDPNFLSPGQPRGLFIGANLQW